MTGNSDNYLDKDFSSFALGALSTQTLKIMSFWCTQENLSCLINRQLECSPGLYNPTVCMRTTWIAFQMILQNLVLGKRRITVSSIYPSAPRL